MEDLSLHILDIIQNSISAESKNIEIELIDSELEGFITLKIADDGAGMDDEILKKIEDPFFTTKGKKTGLGIPLLKQSAIECDGEFRIESSPGKGTKIITTFKRDHIDRKPVGDLGSTMVASILSNPECHLRLTLKKIARDGTESLFVFDTEELKKELENIPINAPAVLKFIEDYLRAQQYSLQIK